MLVLALAPVAHADKAKARDYYRAGQQNYNLTDFEKALTNFTAGYREQEDPVFLFNIAQCHRQLGHKVEAIRLYRSYLRQLPNASNHAEVKNLISRLENELQVEKDNKSQAQGLPTITEPMPPLVVTPPTTNDNVVVAGPPKKKPIYKKAWFWGAVAGGAVVVGGAIALGIVFGTHPSNPNASFGMVTVP